MRLDHFVNKPPQKPSITNNGANMAYNLETPSITSSRGFQSSHLTWIKTMQKNTTNGIYGRIIDTGANYIVEGWNINEKQWVRIPCRRLPDAQLLLTQVMNRTAWEAFRPVMNNQ